MTEDQARREVVGHWMVRAKDALRSAESELDQNRLEFAVNRTYYACFYSASAVLLDMGQRFVKHSGLRSAVHQHLVKPGFLDPRWGKAFDRLFDSRQSADYLALPVFERQQVEKLVEEAKGFVAEMARLLSNREGD